ncbi:DUF1129 family protein [Peribacillus frigoritolerans]|uniref:DUF1129 family protein n=1 Tax=Peribacillus frigoritolerans TaxID=450367 RepID=UPI00207950DE|nr:DUF1129 family protein [Peribacillus frigoritolerans]USK79770.1 DUF1129 family protein [Peribacillus frigoritolerans]WJE47058.1 DUF1129 family protein [Peribacillus frigoritolerans]
MNIKQDLSKKSQSFLENLRLYLFSNGKEEEEINAIVEELEDHLIEAEARGKTVDHIVGESPKQYMKQLSNEMTTNTRNIFKYMLMIIFGALSFLVLTDAVKGQLSYSLFEIIGSVIVSLIFIIAIGSVFKYVAANSLSRTKEYALYYLIGLLPIVLFVGLFYLNRLIETPTFHFGSIGTIITVILTLSFLIGVSLWTKTWVVLIILALLVLPDFLFNYIEVNPDTQLILSTIVTFGGIAIYLYVNHKMSNQQTN